MGRKKKPFIDKKKAHTYKLVARSQHDPLYRDSEEPQNLLHSNEPRGAQDRDTQMKEQIKYGIFFDDDYDYLQHLKKPEMVVMEPAITPGQGEKQGTVEAPQLSIRPFGRDVDLEEKMFPTRAPQLDWDPDIVDALKTAETTSDPQEELEDDFILMANEGQSAVPVYVTEIDDEVTPWWQTRGDFHTAQCPEGSGSSDESDGCDDSDDSEEEIEEDDDRPAGLTECSLSSSVVPRSEVLTLLDNRFEKLMEDYDDNNIGNLAEDIDDAMPTDGDQWLLQTAVQDFENNFTFNTQSLEKKLGEGVTGGMIDEDIETEGETELVEVNEQGQQWDCESILSTYSTLYNHPTKIRELPCPRSVSKRMDTPMETMTPETQEQHKDDSKAIIHRPKEESKEEKKARKKLIKEVKKERRVQKKATKVAFKAEELRIEKVMVAQRNTKPVV